MPGYWFTVAFVDKWGRVPIQYMGFAMMTTLLVILAAAYPQVRTGDWREREGGKGEREWREGVFFFAFFFFFFLLLRHLASGR